LIRGTTNNYRLILIGGYIMTTRPVNIDIDIDNPHYDHIQISTAGIGKASRNDKVMITSIAGDIWITAIDYDGKSSAVEIDNDTLSELIAKVQEHIL